MNALTKIENTALSTMTEAELCKVLQTSLYPGAALDNIKMVLGYCKAAGLDPMQKPVHIVPMWDSKAKQMRDVIMPGVGLYRTQAARSQQLAGITEPEFGPDVTHELSGVTITVPDWCRVTVKRIVDGAERSFTAREFWIENYATAGKDTSAPNSMWKKRPRGQLAKCAQAQALRMAFPEMTGAQPTADEMEGQTMVGDVIDAGSPPPPPPPAVYQQEGFEKNLPAWRTLIEDGKKTADQIITTVETKAPMTDAQKVILRSIKPKAADVEDAQPKVTYAQVADALHKAADADALGAAADLINAVADEAQRAELSAIYGQRREAIDNAS